MEQRLFLLIIEKQGLDAKLMALRKISKQPKRPKNFPKKEKGIRYIDAIFINIEKKFMKDIFVTYCSEFIHLLKALYIFFL